MRVQVRTKELEMGEEEDSGGSWASKETAPGEW